MLLPGCRALAPRVLVQQKVLDLVCANSPDRNRMCPGIGNRAKRGSSHDVEDGNVKGGWVAECTDAECKCTDVGRKASTPEMQSFADRSC